MKPQSIGTEVLQHLLLIQNGTIRAHQHVVVRVEFLKCCVVLACEGSIEHVAMDLQNLIFSHSVSSRSTGRLPFSSNSRQIHSLAFGEQSMSGAMLPARNSPLVVIAKVNLPARRGCESRHGDYV